MPNLGRLSPQESINADLLGRLTVTDATVPSFILPLTFTIPDAASGDIDYVTPEKIEVLDVTCLKRNGAGAGNTVTVKSGANAISDAIVCAVDNAVTRAASIDDANSTIEKNGTLRITATRAAGTRNSQVIVWVVIRP